MHACTYTAQKNKKKKKWIDGFVGYKNNRITVYDEDRKSIYNTVSFKEDDGIIETPLYLVCPDSMEELLSGQASDKTVETVEEGTKKYKAAKFVPFKKDSENKAPFNIELNSKMPLVKENETNAPEESDPDANDVVVVGEKISGRSAADVLELLKK
ncbi:hypothetical protein ENBRE01_2985 [Enteropsectra breve]|nr:hypothetical protein ENBRE01_2985 [Enteropsectra breve]